MPPNPSRPARAAEAISAWVELEAVVVLAERGTAHLLNPTAARIWSLLDGARTAAEIAAIVTQEYEVSPLQAETDVMEAISEFDRRGMLAPGPAHE